MAEPRLGLGYARACADALAEQLVAAVPVPADGVVATLFDSDGILEAALSRRLDSGGIVAVHDEDDLAHLGDGACAAVFCLLTLGFASGAALAEILRIAGDRGGVAVLVYDPDAPPAHEAALRDALEGEGLMSTYLDALLRRDVIDSALRDGLGESTVSDVARFDSPAHFWHVMVQTRPLAAEFETIEPAAVVAVRQNVVAAITRWCAADDTLRIPVTAALLSRLPGPA